MSTAPSHYLERIPESKRKRQITSGDMQGSYGRLSDQEILTELERTAIKLFILAKVSGLVLRWHTWEEISEEYREKWRGMAVRVFYDEEVF